MSVSFLRESRVKSKISATSFDFQISHRVDLPLKTQTHHIRRSALLSMKNDFLRSFRLLATTNARESIRAIWRRTLKLKKLFSAKKRKHYPAAVVCGRCERWRELLRVFLMSPETATHSQSHLVSFVAMWRWGQRTMPPLWIATLWSSDVDHSRLNCTCGGL